MKKIILTITMLMCCLPMLFGRTTACATWALISNATPVNSGSVTGQNDTSFGVSNANPQFSGSYGIGAYDWGMNSQWSPNQYFEFKVSPAALNTFNISNVYFGVSNLVPLVKCNRCEIC